MSEVAKDQFEEILEQKTKLLKHCQEGKNFHSCFICGDLIACPLRKDYVNAVYNSMSKGNTDGGFDF